MKTLMMTGLTLALAAAGCNEIFGIPSPTDDDPQGSTSTQGGSGGGKGGSGGNESDQGGTGGTNQGTGGNNPGGAGEGGAGGTVDCVTIADCPVDVPDCRRALACYANKCIFDDVADGTPLPVQTAGDCVEVVCDGAGKTRLKDTPDDVPDDQNICTLDKCVGSIATSVPQPGMTIACYGGPAGTQDVGICHAGTQQCDAMGQLGPCTGDVTPNAETCDAALLDEDCDGKANEAGANCMCGDGYISTDMGEQCDDGNVNPSDLCTATCQNAACGDGIVQAVIGETCDDGALADDDACSSSCQEQKVLQVALGVNHACAILSGGKVKCWGYNHYGQLGVGDIKNRGDMPGAMGAFLPAVNLGTGKIAIQITAGSDHTCALLNDGSVKCWGYNYYGQLGLGDTQPRGGYPAEMGDNLPSVDLGTGKTAIAVSAGNNHACALLNTGAVKCWGYNSYGQLGQGDTSSRGDGLNEMGDYLFAVNLGTLKTAVAIRAGDIHTCALLNDGKVKCWGYNYHGELGQGDTIWRGDGLNEMGDYLQVVDFGGGLGTTLAAGRYHACALLGNSNLKCWGYNSYGQLGLGDTNWRGDATGEMGSNLPAILLGTGKTATAIAAGYDHTCALLMDSTVKCWGANGYGQLGLGLPYYYYNRGDQPGEMGDALKTVDLGTGKSASAIAAGGQMACALLNNHSIKCWGRNSYGQLGLGDMENRGDSFDETGDKLPAVKLFSDFW